MLTFTRATAGELSKKLATANEGDPVKPSTIHSFAISVLMQNPGAGDFPKPLRIADDWEKLNVVYPTLGHHIGVDVRRLDNLFNEMAAKWERLDEEQSERVRPEDRARFLGGWLEHRAAFGYTLLSEIPDALRVALRNHPDLAGAHFDLLVVDEFQDLNACDLELLDELRRRGATIVAAGDPDQSIYSWRRAAPEGIDRLHDRYEPLDDYPLTKALRCGGSIIDWAGHVALGDPLRPSTRPILRANDEAPPGEVALLSFAGHRAEAKGIAQIARRLIDEEGVPEGEILILLRSDWRGGFSRPIKEELVELGIAHSAPGIVDQMLSVTDHRRLLAALRIAVEQHDSLAWASLLAVDPRVSSGFIERIYDKARGSGNTFATTLLASHEDGFGDFQGPSVAAAKEIVNGVLKWIPEVPVDAPDSGWTEWIARLPTAVQIPSASAELSGMLAEVEAVASPKTLARFLNLVTPVARDIAQTKSEGVRVMSMAASKGLTVQATIVAALEEDVIPNPRALLQEERRLLYVAMTRARRFVFGTWARTRSNQTSRSGRGNTGRRRHTRFLDGGPVQSQDGNGFIDRRWR